jgi:hypothetical protein
MSPAKHLPVNEAPCPLMRLLLCVLDAPCPPPPLLQVKRHYINPKSITLGQLYGEFDKNTHEWRDGILAHVVRLCSRAEGTDLHWIVLDGPVDALWVENLNTVRHRGIHLPDALID